MWFKKNTTVMTGLALKSITTHLRCCLEITVDSQIHSLPQTLRWFHTFSSPKFHDLCPTQAEFPQDTIIHYPPIHIYLPICSAFPTFNRYDLQIFLFSFVDQILSLHLHSKPLVQKLSPFRIINFSSLLDHSHKDINML